MKACNIFLANSLQLIADNKDDEQLLLKIKDSNVFGNFRMIDKRIKIDGLDSSYYDNAYSLTIVPSEKI